MVSLLRGAIEKLQAAGRRTAPSPASEEAEPVVSGRRSPSVAALLSFLWPGLGQLYAGKRRLAAIFAVPAVLALLLLAYQLRQGPLVFIARMADPSFSFAAAVIVILLGALRLVAVVHPFAVGVRRETRKKRRVVDGLVVGLLAAVIVVSHASAGFLMAETSSTTSHVFSPNNDLADLTKPNRTLAPGETPEVTTTPSIDSRVTILITGAGQERPIQYDTMMVVSFDPKTKSVQMVSVPRDTLYYPLYFGDHHVVDSIRLNSFARFAGVEGSPDSPYTTLVNEVSYLVGIHIDYYASVDLNGFAKMIDTVGGIDVVNPDNIDDPMYDWLDGSPAGLNMGAGPQHLDGRHAMAYVRSRDSAGQQDFSRSSRQQDVLVALMHRVATPSGILALPNLMSTIQNDNLLTTNFPADQVDDYIAIGQDIPKERIRQVVLSVGANYSEYVGSAVCLYNNKVAALSRDLFGQDSLFDHRPDLPNTCP
jgi:LCP family protein required for cell wall assembly